jgi:CHAD domain-containing protein
MSSTDAHVEELPPELAGPYLAAKLRAQASRIHEAAPRVLASGDDEAVHDLRVAIRRTRVVLEVGRSVLGRFRADESRRALREVQSATGALRDEEVLLELITSLGVDRLDVRAWLDARQRRERRLRSALRRRIRAGELENARELIAALLAFRIKPSRERRLAKFAVRAVDAAANAVWRSKEPSVDDVEGLHDFRIRCKRLRYTIEVFAGVLPPEKAGLGPAASKLQSRLGDVHDIDVALACVARARALTDVARRRLSADLRALRQTKMTRYLADLGEARAAVP